MVNRERLKFDEDFVWISIHKIHLYQNTEKKRKEIFVTIVVTLVLQSFTSTSTPAGRSSCIKESIV